MGEVFFLGVDIGTYSSKGVLVRADGKVAASHQVPHAMRMPKPGYFEHDGDQVWWNDFVQIVIHLLRESKIDPRQIAAVGTSAIGPCVLPINEQGHPLRPGILYGIDTRASEQVAFLERLLGKDQIYQWCAMHLNSQAAGPKVLWIREKEPEVFHQARWFLTSQAYLVYKLTGLPSIDVYTAGAYAPLFDVYRQEWNPVAAKPIVSIDRLPPTYWSGEVVGSVNAAAAHETGLIEGTPVVAGTADAAAEALSAGMAHDGDLLIMFGSSIFFILKTNKLVPTQRFWSSNFLQTGTYAVAGGMSTAGSLTTWFRDQLAAQEVAAEMADGVNAFTILANAAAGSPVGARGLISLPYFEGERTPLHDPKARGMWFGLSLNHTRADLYRSILEGTAFGIRHNLEAMAQEGLQPKRLLVSGGGIHNRLWLQIVADVCGVNLLVPDQLAGACYGDAFLASIGAGFHRDISDIEHWVVPKETIQFNPENHARYSAFYQIFKDLYVQTKTQMHQLTDLITGEEDHE